METIVASGLAVVLVVGLVALVRRMRATRRVLAAEVMDFERPPYTVDREVRAALADLPGARVARLEPGHVRVIIRRSPPWTVLVAMLAFPVGLAALLYRQDIPLDVWVYESGHGTQLQLAGPTEAHVLERVRSALLALPRAAEQVPATEL